MEKTQEEYDNLCDQKSSKENEKAQVEAEIASIDEQIETLQAAYDDIDEALEEIRDIRDKIKNPPNECVAKWEGQVAQAVFTSCESGDLYTSYQTYIDDIDAVRDELNLKLTELENKRSEKYGFLQGIISSLNDLWTSIQNYWN